jgi:hypothetical protein
MVAPGVQQPTIGSSPPPGSTSSNAPAVVSLSGSQHHPPQGNTSPVNAVPQQQQQTTQGSSAPVNTATTTSTAPLTVTSSVGTVTVTVTAPPQPQTPPGSLVVPVTTTPTKPPPASPAAPAQPAANAPTTPSAPAAQVQQPSKPTLWKKLNPFAEPDPPDDRYKNFVTDKLEDYPRGYPSVAAFISGGIDGRVYRRFSYVRNRLLLWYQDQIVYLEKRLTKLDNEHFIKASKGDRAAQERLICRWYDEDCGSERKGILQELEEILGKYDDIILREHEIMSIRKATDRMHRGLFNFIWNGKEDADKTTRKHLRNTDYEYLFHHEDFMILGSQEDAWLGTWVGSVRRILPERVQDWILASAKDREESASVANVSFYSNKRVGRFVKGVVCAANTVLLVVPILILYAVTLNQASGWLKIGILLIFVVIFAFLVAALTNASRSDMFAACAG